MLSIHNFVRPREYSVFAVHDINGLKLLTRLRLNFSHLNEHKFRNNFNHTINLMHSCGKEPKKTLHYLLRCNLYSIYRLELLNDISALNHSLRKISEENLLTVLHYGAGECFFKINSEILKQTIKFINEKIDLVAHYFLLNFFFFPLTKYLVFKSLYIFYIQNSMYRIYIKRYMSYVNIVPCVFLFHYFYFQQLCNQLVDTFCYDRKKNC